MRQPTDAIARRAWEFLIRRMTNELEGMQREQLKAEVIFRESIEPVTLRSRSGARIRNEQA